MTLALRDLTVSYGGHAALDRVSLDVAEGEIVALVGESGCGKTSLARALLGLLSAAARVSGSALLGEEELVGRTSWAGLRGRRIAILPQGAMAGLSPVHRIGGQLTEMLTLHGGTAEPAGLLERVGLPPGVLRCYPHELSGGQRQRVAIARALAGDPVLLIADEATSMLDVSTRAGIATTLRSLATERGLAVLFVTHDLGEAVQSCDRIVVLQAGVIVEHGPSADVAAAPTHPYTIRLLQAAR